MSQIDCVGEGAYLSKKEKEYKVIFLDFDGVLNSGNYIKHLDGEFDNPINQMDPTAVIRLNRITDLTGAKIVVSSTWRLAFINQANSLDMLQRCLSAYKITGDVIGMTTNKSNAIRNVRGKEIQLWLDQHHGEVEKFVIVDDDSDMGRLGSHLVKTLFADGLQDSHVEKIVSILGYNKITVPL